MAKLRLEKVVCFATSLHLLIIQHPAWFMMYILVTKHMLGLYHWNRYKQYYKIEL